ncbi:MAG: FecR domain-containing protein [Chloroflexi bacterium]|nr:FecR domain-containing protein [Chloroflexota bacterium]
MMSENGTTHKMDAEEVLQQKLTQLELGYPLDETLADAPEQEARLLQLAVALQATPFPAEDEAMAAEQRARLLRVTKGLALKPIPVAEPTAATPAAGAAFVLLLDRLRAGMDGLLQRRELAVGLSAALVVVVAILAVGLFRWQDSRQAGMAAQDESSALVDAGPERDSAPSVGPEAGETATGEETAAANPTADEPIAALPDATAGHSIFLPVTTNPLVTNAQTAVLETIHGLVERQNEDGSWTVVPRLSSLTAGQRIRTGSLSQASLTFYDGSQATLSANSELTIEQLNALRAEEGLRTIVLTQHLGESDHYVQFRSDGGSRYEVNTPAGSGIARGTQFRVLVTPELQAQFAVSEGKVDVTGLNQTVSVVAGQTTAVLAGSPPQPPAFRIYGEGEVSQIGPVWTIAGQTFETNDRTRIIGAPQVGDLVRVEGRLLDDGRRLADRITLLRRAVANRFTLSGAVESIAATVWAVAGQTILVDANTRLDDDIVIGNRVRVQGVILAGGTLRAERIERLDDLGHPFRFTGLVEMIGRDAWTISGVTIAVNAATAVDNGLVIGDLVEVRGRILDDGTWLARRITRASDDLPEFSFSGRVQAIDPWQVAGVTFETREWTAVDPSISIGDRVRVHGVILADGTWVASSIQRLGGDDDDDDYDSIILVGIVSSINPWVVNGLQLFLTDSSRILGDIRVGDLVLVRLRLAADGTWQVVSIRPFTPRFGLGCLVINTIVLGVQPNQLTLQHWPTLSLDDDDFDDLGDIALNSVITLPLCFSFDGVIVIIAPIIIIYPPIVIIMPPAPPQPPQPPPRGNNNGNNNRNNNG